MKNDSIAWPPPYIVKKHPKARCVKLRASAKVNGLEITIPPRFSIKHLPDVLEENRLWIIKQLEKLAISQTWELPQAIEFYAVGESWRVFYVPCQIKLRLMNRPGNELVLIGPIENKNQCAKLLQRWIKARAKTHLQHWLNYLSNKTQLCYNMLTIRDQKTRWGSCNSDKNINLNYKLLFLSPELMQHVIIHELCHTKYLNHSEKFWQLVAKFDLNCEAHKRALRRADQFIPKWVQSV